MSHEDFSSTTALDAGDDAPSITRGVIDYSQCTMQDLFGDVELDSVLGRAELNEVVKSMCARQYDELVSSLRVCELSVKQLLERRVVSNAGDQLRMTLSVLDRSLATLKKRVLALHKKPLSHTVLMLGGYRSLNFTAYEIVHAAMLHLEHLFDVKLQTIDSPKVVNVGIADLASSSPAPSPSLGKKKSSSNLDSPAKLRSRRRSLSTGSPLADRSIRISSAALLSGSSKSAKSFCKKVVPVISLLDLLNDKLKLCNRLKTDTPFVPADTAIAKPGERGPDTIFASYIIGFEFDKQLKDYAKQLKSMYCAVGDKRRNAGFVQKNVAFSSGALKYAINEEQASRLYEEQLKIITADFLCEVWALLEDPMIKFFATSLGFVARNVALATDKRVLLPCTAPRIDVETREPIEDIVPLIGKRSKRDKKEGSKKSKHDKSSKEKESRGGDDDTLDASGDGEKVGTKSSKASKRSKSAERERTVAEDNEASNERDTDKERGKAIRKQERQARKEMKEKKKAARADDGDDAILDPKEALRKLVASQDGDSQPEEKANGVVRSAEGGKDFGRRRGHRKSSSFGGSVSKWSDNMLEQMVKQDEMEQAAETKRAEDKAEAAREAMMRRSATEATITRRRKGHGHAANAPAELSRKAKSLNYMGLSNSEDDDDALQVMCRFVYTKHTPTHEELVRPEDDKKKKKDKTSDEYIGGSSTGIVRRKKELGEAGSRSSIVRRKKDSTESSEPSDASTEAEPPRLTRQGSKGLALPKLPMSAPMRRRKTLANTQAAPSAIGISSKWTGVMNKLRKSGIMSTTADSLSMSCELDSSGEGPPSPSSPLSISSSGGSTDGGAPVGSPEKPSPISPGTPSRSKRSSMWFGKKLPDLVNEGSPDSGIIVLHIHGGGFCATSCETHLTYLQPWAALTDYPIVSVNYKLAPKYPYPSQVNECFGVYEWLLDRDNLKRLGLNVPEDVPIRIIVTGDSAGGNLSCIVTLRAIEEGLPLPIGLLLTYPVVNLSTSMSHARILYSNDPVLNFQSTKVVLESYMGSNIELAWTEHLLSPGVAPKEVLAQFPPTVILTGDVDPLLDDSIYFFHRLLEVGVRTVLKIYHGLPHGYLMMRTSHDHAKYAVENSALFLKWLVQVDDFRRSREHPLDASGPAADE